MMKYLLSIGFIFLSLSLSFSQNFSNRVDSLKSVSNKQSGDSLISTLGEISWEFRNSNLDSSFHYSEIAIKKAKEIKSLKGEASAYNSLANVFEAATSLDSAVFYHQKSLAISRRINDSLQMANSLNNLGIIFDLKGAYKEALENYFEALRIFESHESPFYKIPMIYVNIGIVYKKQKVYDKVLDYYKRALAIYQENNYVIGEVITTGNIGSLLLNMERYNESMDFSKRAEFLYDSLGYSRYVPYMRNNIAVAKDSLGFHEEAKADFQSSIKQFKDDNNLYELVNSKIGYGKNLMSIENFREADRQLSEALKIAIENDFKEWEYRSYKYLSESRASLNDYKSAWNYHKLYTIRKDSVFESDKTKMVFELETKYETEKKEKEILSQRASLAENELNLSKKNNYIIFLVGLAVVLILLGYLFYSNQRAKNRQLIKDNELQVALAEIETQNQLQEQRLRISRDLHDNIGSQLTFVISSLDNLKFGKKLPENIAGKLSQIGEFTAATIHELRDTIWAMNKSDITLEDLLARFSNYIEKANLAATNTLFSLNLDESIDMELSFSSLKGINIYRIVQEAFNNAIKYSKSERIELSISNDGNNMAFEIKDFGIGFDTTIDTLGNGLNNISKRAKEIGAKLDISSALNEGTTIVLQISKNT